MNSFDLDIFLREFTFFEKFILSNINPNDINSLKHFIENTKFDENIMRKLPLPNGQSIEEFFVNFKKTYKDTTILNRTDGIVFICHPRFSKTVEHHHNYIEMIYVYSGELHQMVNGVNIVMKKGEVCILDTNVVHSIDTTSENDIIINCIMSEKYLDDILLNRLSGNDLLSSFFIHAIYQSNDYNNYMLFKSGNSVKLTKLIEDVLCEYFDNSPCSDEVINSYMVIIFSELLKVFQNQSNSENYDLLKNTKITDIILYIQNNYKDATLASTAKNFHFHPNYLNSIIKKFQGNNFTHVLQESKLKKAAFLLKSSSLPVVSVSKNVGYENISFFYKIFKKSYGCTPTEYRKKLLNK
ncbi:AraC family transcriptional regulator [Clostridium estertheticum]|uniref:AraC family transcriptional regulator n=1 Tax=Clostridium estertheticum TaxID=238834 RepID=UPI001CF0F6B9|nr:AraC family transcriptional regulator [Clostridium estertheticum]MCB2358532.1 AraC family transcriptional regulator [Clostridium estertheticum]